MAYSSNSDPDDKDYPFINFCDGFLNRRNLADAITYGKSLKSPDNLKPASYDNRAQTFYVSTGAQLCKQTYLIANQHELTHISLAANSPKPNPRVTDLQVDIKLRSSSRSYTLAAYGPLGSKLVARWQAAPGLGSTGYWVQRNADNLAYYALVKYIMTKNGNVGTPRTSCDLFACISTSFTFSRRGSSPARR